MPKPEEQPVMNQTRGCDDVVLDIMCCSEVLGKRLGGCGVKGGALYLASASE